MEIFEAFPSRDTDIGERNATELAYIIAGTGDDVTARAFLELTSPATHGGLYRQGAQLKQITHDTWAATVRYGAIKEPEAGDWKWDFDASGTTQKITQGKANVANYAPAGEVAPDFKGAIGVTDTGIEGCDIIVPQFKWNETHQLSTDLVTWAYSQTLYDMVGTTNAAAFRGFAIGEVLFMGARGSQSAKSPDLVEMTYSFSAARHAAALAVGDIAGIAKKAHDYLWVRYSQAEDAAAKKLVKRPSSVHVERVYDSSDFSDLLIGTT